MRELEMLLRGSRVLVFLGSTLFLLAPAVSQGNGDYSDVGAAKPRLWRLSSSRTQRESTRSPATASWCSPGSFATKDIGRRLRSA